MADRAGKGVCGVVWLRVVIEVKEVAHHEGDLVLICRTGSHHSLLDLHGRVLAHLHARKGAGDERRAPGMRRRYGGSNVRAEINSLDGSGMRLVAVYDRRELIHDMPQARSKLIFALGVDAAVCPAPAFASALLLMLARSGEATRRSLPAYPVVSACSFIERAWPVSLAWSDVGRQGEEPKSLELFVQKEIERAERSLGL